MFRMGEGNTNVEDLPELSVISIPTRPVIASLGSECWRASDSPRSCSGRSANSLLSCSSRKVVDFKSSAAVSTIIHSMTLYGSCIFYSFTISSSSRGVTLGALSLYVLTSSLFSSLGV